MILRKLEMKDAPYMFEWMQDKYVTCRLKKDFSKLTLKDVEAFIISSWDSSQHNVHFAIVSETDEYMGTVSLKHIENGWAEFGIVVRRCAMGSGCAKEAMKKILYSAHKDYGIKHIYWCVDIDNIRALRFYDKNGYHRVEPSNLKIRGVQHRRHIKIPLVFGGRKIIESRCHPFVNHHMKGGYHNGSL